jgi:hypothetical protein
MHGRSVRAGRVLRASGSALALIAVMTGPPARADDWPAAQIKEVFSQSREWFVRVTPGDSLGETYGFAGAPRGKHATAEFYRRASNRSYRLAQEITLQNPIAPVLFLVTDRGYLLTLDNWHNMGFGKAVASYSPDGRLVFASELKDLFSPEEIDGFRRTVSSIWWRTETVYIRDGQQSIFVALNDQGSSLIVEPETGRWQVCQQRGDLHQCRDANAPRVWRAYQEPPRRQ